MAIINYPFSWQLVWLNESQREDCPIYAFSELIDNSIAARIGERVNIWIFFFHDEQDKNKINCVYLDDACGMGMEEQHGNNIPTKGTLNYALFPHTFTMSHNAQNIYGRGTQAGLGWLMGDGFEVWTKKENENIIHCDMKPDSDPGANVHYTIEDIGPNLDINMKKILDFHFNTENFKNSHFTLYKIRDVTFPTDKIALFDSDLKNNHVSLASLLGFRYRKPLFEGKLNIRLFGVDEMNGETIAPPVIEDFMLNESYIRDVHKRNSKVNTMDEWRELLGNIQSLCDNTYLPYEQLEQKISTSEPWVFNLQVPIENNIKIKGHQYLKLKVHVLKPYTNMYKYYSGMEIADDNKFIYSLPILNNPKGLVTAIPFWFNGGGGTQASQRIRCEIDITDISFDEINDTNVQFKDKIILESHKKSLNRSRRSTNLYEFISGTLLEEIRKRYLKLMNLIKNIEKPDKPDEYPISENDITIEYIDANGNTINNSNFKAGTMLSEIIDDIEEKA